MRWKNGLFRLWLVLSVIWLLTLGIALRPERAFFDYREHNQAARQLAAHLRDVRDSSHQDAATKADFTDGLARLTALDNQVEDAKNRMEMFAILGPSASFALLVVGLMFAWAFAGFQAKRDE